MQKLDRLLIKPGEIFSFCNIVGRTSKRKGYLNGLEMHRGKMVGAPGGGLCQIANLLYWMALHLNLHIIERHHHDMDLFPDDERSVPFGMGASVFYNYIDFRFRNNLPQSLLLRISVSHQLLCGAIMSDRDKFFDVVVSETLHRFVRADDGSVWRENRVVKRVTYRDGHSTVEEEIAHNFAQVCYQVSDDKIEQVPGTQFRGQTT